MPPHVKPCQTADASAPHVQHPRSFYVSYASTHRLGELLSLLKEHFEVESQPDVMLWLEVMAVNPQEGRAKLLNGDLDRVLMDTQKLVFCIDERCGSLSDAWCLYEVRATAAVLGWWWARAWDQG